MQCNGVEQDFLPEGWHVVNKFVKQKNKKKTFSEELSEKYTEPTSRSKNVPTGYKELE